MMLVPTIVPVDLFLTMLTGCLGVAAMWAVRRRTSLSAKNAYPPAAIAACLFALFVLTRLWVALLVLLPLGVPFVCAAVFGRRWRQVDLDAGEELRNHELSRHWLWEPAPILPAGERRYLRSQGELVHERSWPKEVEYISMTARRDAGPRLPLGAGQHVVVFGATGAGKTTTARRLIAARTLAQDAALFVLDQKGDQEDVSEMRRLEPDRL
jgi:Helicase HerA, central domain